MMLKLLFFSRDPAKNYQSFKKYSPFLLIFSLAVVGLTYFVEGLSSCLIVAGVLLLAYGIEAYSAKRMLNVHDPAVLAQAYKNGFIVNLISIIAMCIMYFWIFEWQWALFYSAVLLVGGFWRIRKQNK